MPGGERERSGVGNGSDEATDHVAASVSGIDDEGPTFSRSSVYPVLLIVGAGALVTGALVAVFYENAVAGLAYDQRNLIRSLPDPIRSLPSTFGVYVLGATILAINVALIARGRLRTVLLVDLAVAIGAIGGKAADVALDGVAHSSVLEKLLAEQLNGQTIPTITTSPLLVATISGLTLAGPWLSDSWRRAWIWTVAAYVALVSVLSTSGFLGVLVDVGVGLVAGAAVGWLVPTPETAPSGTTLVAVLRRAGLRPRRLGPIERTDEHGIRRSVEFDDGTEGELLVLTSDGRAATWLRRVGRSLRRRGPNGVAIDSLRHQAEHETLATDRARELGVRTGAVLAFGPAGSAAWMLARQPTDGQSLAELDADALTVAMPAVWEVLDDLRRGFIAHRRLRPERLRLDDNGSVGVTSFSHAAVAADDAQLDDDVVEVLTWSAVRIGADRAVEAALSRLPAERIIGAIVRLHPLAVTGPTRDELHKDTFKQLREAIERSTGEEELPSSEDLSRFSPRRILTFSMIGAALYFLLPQLADAGNLWEEARTADLGWGLAATAFSVVSYVGAAMAIMGSVPSPMSFRPTFLAQVAASFSSTVTPAKVGGMALNARFLSKQGVEGAVAASGVGISIVAGFAVHLILLATFVTAAGSNLGNGSVSGPSTTTILVILGVLVLVSIVVMLTPWGRKVLLKNVLPALRRARQGLVAIMTNPAKVALLLGGSAWTTLGYLFSLYAATLAFGGKAGVLQVGVVYLSGAIVASAAPTPGGLGAAEAAYIAGLTAIGLASSIAVPAVFLFRLVTFWLPVLPGWLAFTSLRRSGDL